MNAEELREELEEDLRGECCCNYITKDDMHEILKDFDNWLETAEPGDAYYYGGNSYELV